MKRNPLLDSLQNIETMQEPSPEYHASYLFKEEESKDVPSTPQRRGRPPKIRDGIAQPRAPRQPRGTGKRGKRAKKNPVPEVS
ncbi:unnamed protein product [Blepharisma stoltei]|uniref:Uncharacterized protein n=1 Tax=Blepharisma stoltei TaxID=1481888 RepID=A0AAU9K0K5_9CILI|nr:unnamed protein product [Blepharisma stoltei]